MRSLDLCTYSTSLKQKPVEKYHRNEKYRTLLLSSLTFPTMLKTTKTNSLESEVILSWQSLKLANNCHLQMEKYFPICKLEKMPFWFFSLIFFSPINRKDPTTFSFSTNKNFKKGLKSTYDSNLRVIAVW